MPACAAYLQAPLSASGRFCGLGRLQVSLVLLLYLLHGLSTERRLQAQGARQAQHPSQGEWQTGCRPCREPRSARARAWSGPWQRGRPQDVEHRVQHAACPAQSTGAPSPGVRPRADGGRGAGAARSSTSAHRQEPGAEAACAHRQTLCASLDQDNASVLVCGGGGVALLVAKQLRDQGAWVWMLQRSQSRK